MTTTLTDRELALGVVLASCADSVPPAWLLELAGDGLAGITLFGANVASPEMAHRFIQELREVHPSLLIAIDEEGGSVSRLDASAGGRTPDSAALGRIDELATTMTVSTAVATRLRAIGVDINFAPVADVNTEAANRAIGIRSFSDDPEVVARHVMASVVAAAPHLATCVKHFPGHGSVVEDSHFSLPLVSRTREELDAIELVPFRVAIEAGVECVMLAHLHVPALSDRATSQSPETVALLREDLGFAGVIVSDALDMRAVGGVDEIGAAGVESLAAGVDLLCLGAELDAHQVEAAIDAIVRALVSGRLDRDRLLEARQRIERLRLRLTTRPPGTECGSGEDQADRQRLGYSVDASGWTSIAQRAIDVDGTLAAPGPFRLVECQPPLTPASADLDLNFARYAEDGITNLASTVLLSDASEAAALDLGAIPTLVVVHGLDAYPWQRELVERLSHSGQLAGVVELGWPSPLPTTSPFTVRSFGAAAPCSRAAALAVADAMTRS